ncbi:hypothetical protein [uncultured Cyclobacterium sp.]|uniref:hypothetical protein n=1 Tax=uncultured Cyclobacterium sp. TaxID=453820 RepID=UPI0030ED4D9F|tara:strand:- start:1348 stop:1674 length:327 start_codon:yes stop_codon:yes gene_type:complete
MKKIFIMLAMVAFTSMAYAQVKRPEPPTTDEIIEMATKELGLSDEQVIEWKSIHEKYADVMKSRKMAKEARAKIDNELQATLTGNQLETYLEIKKERENQRPARRPRE